MRPKPTTVVLACVTPLSALYLLLSASGGIPESNMSLLLTFLGVEGSFRVLDSAGSETAIVVAGLLGALVYAVVRVWLWARGRRGPGSWLLLAAAVSGALGLLAQAFLFALTRGNIPWSGEFVIPIFRLASAWGWIVSPLALILLGVGLLRSRLVPSWVAVVAVVAAVLYAVNSVDVGYAGHVIARPVLFDALPAGMYLVAMAAEVAFLVATGLSLVWREMRPSAVEQARPADGVGVEQQGSGAVHR